jgi:hypothetical protein
MTIGQIAEAAKAAGVDSAKLTLALHEPVYFYQWRYGTGHVTFGNHCTETEWLAQVTKQLKTNPGSPINLIEKKGPFVE